MNDEQTLVCEAFGNPKEVKDFLFASYCTTITKYVFAQNLFQMKMTFQWTMKSGNDTAQIVYSGPGSGSGTSSPLTINNDKNVEYRCVANNSVGTGTECEIKINGMRDFCVENSIF